jgi:sialidase-1
MTPRTAVPLLAGLLLLSPWPATAGPTLNKSDLFEGGKGCYQLYRIPGLVATKKGTLLAYCEARKSDRGDWGTIDLLLRRSTDGGRTWSAPRNVARVKGPHRKNPVALAQKLARSDDVTYNNPVAIADHRTGAVHFLFCLEYMRCFYQRSDDDGQTFPAPVEITSTFERFRKHYAWKVLATGPGHGIHLQRGRLLVPVWLSTGTGGHAHRPSAIATIYSDDGGKTWQAGDIVADDTGPLINPNEATAVELAGGRVMLNIRSESKQHRRAITTSPDGATKWSRPSFDDQLVEPICMASLCRYDARRILFANPHNLGRERGKAVAGQGRDRKNLTVKLSSDEGKTWSVSRVLDPGVSGYCDLAVLPDGTICCLYERGSRDGKSFYATRALTLARFNLDWLTEKP